LFSQPVQIVVSDRNGSLLFTTNPFMKHLALLLLLASLVACKQEEQKPSNDATSPNKDSLRAELLQVDRSWSEESQRVGFNRSKLNHLSDDAINFSSGAMPVVGKQKFAEQLAQSKDNEFSLQWEPLRCEVAASGDLGYTFGGWTMRTKENNKDTALYGNYITVWERDASGAWKVAADGGGDTPEPLTKL
jgi:ketosteroid isomerase-like protein